MTVQSHLEPMVIVIYYNKNEKILTIADMNETTTAERITQIAGRVRFSYNKA